MMWCDDVILLLINGTTTALSCSSFPTSVMKDAQGSGDFNEKCLQLAVHTLQSPTIFSMKYKKFQSSLAPKNVQMPKPIGKQQNTDENAGGHDSQLRQRTEHQD